MKKSPLESPVLETRTIVLSGCSIGIILRMPHAISGTFTVSLSSTTQTLCMHAIFFLNWTFFPKQILPELPMERLYREVYKNTRDVQELPLRLDRFHKLKPFKDSHKDTSYRDQGQGLLSEQSACTGASQSAVSMHRSSSVPNQHAQGLLARALELRFGRHPGLHCSLCSRHTAPRAH